MSQKSVIVVTTILTLSYENARSGVIDNKVFSSLKIACKYYEWEYNTLCRKGDSFVHKHFLIQRKRINRDPHEVWG